MLNSIGMTLRWNWSNPRSMRSCQAYSAMISRLLITQSKCPSIKFELLPVTPWQVHKHETRSILVRRVEPCLATLVQERRCCFGSKIINRPNWIYSDRGHFFPDRMGLALPSHQPPSGGGGLSLRYIRRVSRATIRAYGFTSCSMSLMRVYFRFAVD